MVFWLFVFLVVPLQTKSDYVIVDEKNIVFVVSSIAAV